MAAKRGGYESAAALRAQAAGSTRLTQAAGAPKPTTSGAHVSAAEFEVVAEYATALEAENLELKSARGNDASVVSSLPNTIAATTTTNTAPATGLIEEMKRALEAQAKSHAAQVAQLTALVKAAATAPVPELAPAWKGGGARVIMNPAGTRRVRHDPPKGMKTTGVDRSGRAVRTCANCTKNWVTHADADCLKLETNAANRKAGWKSYFM